MKIPTKTSLHYGLIVVFMHALSGVYAQNAQLTVDASKVLNRVFPLIYGSCMEDVNHEIYGGLYDQKIFGESFEEPTSGMDFTGFSKYEGLWDLQEQLLSVQSWPGAKLISTLPAFSDGSVEMDLRFTSVFGENAGFIVRTSAPGNGADAFNGYEVSLLHGGKRLRLGKHQQNYTLLREVDVNVDHKIWTHLKVVLLAGSIKVYINNALQPALDYTDTNPLLNGTMGLRTWNSDVQFKNVVVSTAQGQRTLEFKGSAVYMVSSTWDEIRQPGDSLVFNLDGNNPYNGFKSQGIQYVRGTGRAGIANQSLNRWGIAVEQGQVFQGRLYLRAQNLSGPVTVALQSQDGSKIYASQTFEAVGEDWAKHTFQLMSNTTDDKARFAVWIDKPGKLWVDQVVLMQTDEKQFQGLPIRADIGKGMQQEGLTFLRYGGTMVNAPEYRFKKMIGDRDKREPYKGHWYRYSTNGFGIEDFLQFSEAAGFAPAFAINIEETAQDAADMVEYLNGDATTQWGSKRAANGHPQPYKVKYIEIGNEEVLFEGDDTKTYQHYLKRFNDLYAAMHAKDSSIQFIHSAWWRPGSPNMKMVFDSLNGKAAYWDYHPWADEINSGTLIDKELTEMQNFFLKQDPQSTMKCVIFEENGNLHNLQRALGHATVLNAVRKHSDFVLTSCAANALQPYKQNDNGWDQGQLFFTPSKVWGMPPFYAQQMASAHHQPWLVASNSTMVGLNVSATKSESGDTLVLHVVNTTAAVKRPWISLKGFGVYGQIQTTVLSGSLSAENTLSNPEQIKPIKSTFESRVDSFKVDFPAYSYSVLRFVPVANALHSNKKSKKLTVLPNPMNDQLSITCNGLCEVELLDSAGKIVRTEAVGNTGKMDVSTLIAGLYYVRLKNSREEEAVKLLKR